MSTLRSKTGYPLLTLSLAALAGVVAALLAVQIPTAAAAPKHTRHDRSAAKKTARESVVRRPLRRPQTLRGPIAQLATVMRFDDPRGRLSAPVLELRWRASALLDWRRSSLSVEVGDVAQRSIWLYQHGHPRRRNKLWVSLGAVPAGFHRVVLRARLRVEGDRCLRQHRQEAWLVVESLQLSWRRRRLEAALPELDLATLPKRWKSSGTVTIRFASSPQRFEPTDARALAYLEADHLLRRWGVATPRQRPGKGNSTLHLASLGDDHGWPRLARRLEQAPEARAVASLDGDELRILARRPRDLTVALRSLADDTLRSRCRRASCLFGPRDDSKGPRDELEDPATATVLDLARRGFAKGFVARGRGTHRLRLSWRRPQGWQLRAHPTLLLRVRAGGPLEKKHSWLQVSLGERPLESWALPLSRRGVTELAVRLPRAAWAEQRWDLEVSVHLEPRADERCHPTSARALWASLEPDSRLDVPRVEERRASLAAFARRLRSRRPLLASAASLPWSEGPRIAALLYPFAKAAPQVPWRAVEVDRCRGECVVFHRGGVGNGGLRLVQLAGLPHWLDSGGHLALPLLPAMGSVLLEREELSAGPRLRVVLIPGPAEVPAPPSYEQLHVRRALFVQRWLALDPGALLNKTRVSARTAASPAAHPGDQARAQRRRDLLWIAGGTLVLLALAFWLWRGRRADLDGEDPNATPQITTLTGDSEVRG